MKDEYRNIKKQSCITIFFKYCIYFYDIQLIHFLIDEITQLGIITVYFFYQLFAKKYWFPLFLTKAWLTNGQTDQRTDWRTDRPGYRDTRMHLKMEGWTDKWTDDGQTLSLRCDDASKKPSLSLISFT